jgi:TLC ATP/ADP transporter
VHPQTHVVNLRSNCLLPLLHNQPVLIYRSGMCGVQKEKKKMPVGESFAFLAKSTYIRCMAVLVVAYGICINLVEARPPPPKTHKLFAQVRLTWTSSGCL